MRASSVRQSQTAVTAYLESKQLPLFAFVLQMRKTKSLCAQDRKEGRKVAEVMAE